MALFCLFPKNRWRIQTTIALIVGALTLWSVGTSPCLAETFEASDHASEIIAPAGWVQHADLNESAEIQISFPRKGIYLIVLTEDRSDFVDMTIEKYAKRRLADFTGKLIEVAIEKTAPLIVNGMSGSSTDFSAVVDDLRIRYQQISLVGRQKFFQILVWGTKSQFEASRDASSEIVRAFRER